MKRMSLVAMSAAMVLLAVTVVTASPRVSKSPLYVYRMESESSKLNFLPTERNEVIYNTEGGYVLNYAITAESLGEYVLGSTQPSCSWTCVHSTCEQTCPGTCGSTCSTCPYQTKCSTCIPNTCQGC